MKKTHKKKKHGEELPRNAGSLRITFCSCPFPLSILIRMLIQPYENLEKIWMTQKDSKRKLRIFYGDFGDGVVSGDLNHPTIRGTKRNYLLPVSFAEERLEEVQPENFPPQPAAFCF